MKIASCISITALILIASCASVKGKSKTITVKGRMLAEQPVCADGQNSKGENIPVPNAEYYLRPGTTKNDLSVIATKSLKTDENGNFSLKLEPGTYAVIYTDKMMSYAEFKLKHDAKSNYMKNRDDRCFEKWYESADFILNVTKDTTITHVIKSRCYTKTNPCWEYTGPK